VSETRSRREVMSTPGKTRFGEEDDEEIRKYR